MGYKVAVVGATGNVGRPLVAHLAEALALRAHAARDLERAPLLLALVRTGRDGDGPRARDRRHVERERLRRPDDVDDPPGVQVVDPVPDRREVGRRVEEEGERMVEKLHDILPRQMFVLKIQAHALGRIIASRSISALRKDVTGYLYGGDITRKMKLLEKQKKGKKRRGEHAKMDIPQEVFMKMVQDSER